MKDKLMQLILILGIAALIVCVVMTIIMFIGSLKITDGCLLRYDPDKGEGMSDTVTNSFMLDATANNTLVTINKPDGSFENKYDPAHYGKDWTNSNMSVAKDQEIKLKIEGEISLCKAYLPRNNIQQESDLDNNGKRVEIPRVEDVDAEPVSLIFNAKTNKWRNIAELYSGDSILVSILPNQKHSVASEMVYVKDVFNNEREEANCSEGEDKYEPLCGRYSIYSGEYVSDCRLSGDCNINNECMHKNPKKVCWSFVEKTVTAMSWCIIDFVGATEYKYECTPVRFWHNITSPAPEKYRDDGYFTFPISKYNELTEPEIGKLLTKVNLECSNNVNIASGLCNTSPNVDRSEKDMTKIKGSYQNERYFWYAAPVGLVSRLDNNEAPTNAEFLGSNYRLAKYERNETYDGLYNNGQHNDNNKYQIIYNITPTREAKEYLQYRLWSNSSDYSKNTGGYVLNIKQTKCKRKNGKGRDDPGFANRGKVQFKVVPYDQDINECGSACSTIDINTDDDGNAKIKMDKAGYLYMRILNKPEDYKDSYGRYRVQMFTSMKVGSFTLQILNPLFQTLREQVENASIKIFKNMTCYGGGNNCSNFFTYIKLTLILYVMTYGAMFILGIVKINQQDLLIRIVKIAIVSGLMNGSTFEFFNNYIRPLISNFSDGIISNMSGYSMFSTTNTIANPFMFLDAVMSKILFGKTFSGQLLSFLSMGLSGVIYFVLVFIAVLIVIITALRAIAVYVMAFMAVALLVGIAPLFFTFMLFDFTRYLFENWVRFTLRYMMEPVILMAGIIVMTQLFTIYLDYVLGFSVCWKCALPIKMPFIGIAGFTPAFIDVPIFCINWFAPWGMDYRSGMMGVNMQHFIALIIIAYGMYGYVEFSGKMVAKLTSTAGPSATQMGRSMSDAAEKKVLGEVGLDKNSRAQIKQKAKQRLKTRNKTLDKVNKANREGKKDNNDGGSATT
ncbi:MAG: type IV secretion system protein [Candidatus Rickettsia vulgarisii]